MAVRPKAICRKVACGALLDKPGYCAKHAPLTVGWNRSHGDKSSTERGYGADWRKRRARVLTRDCGLCQIKGKGCTIVAREVDHVVGKEQARAQGWTEDQIEDDANLQSACVTCHAAKTHMERGRGGSKV